MHTGSFCVSQIRLWLKNLAVSGSFFHLYPKDSVSFWMLLDHGPSLPISQWSTYKGKCGAQEISRGFTTKIRIWWVADPCGSKWPSRPSFGRLGWTNCKSVLGSVNICKLNLVGSTELARLGAVRVRAEFLRKRKAALLSRAVPETFENPETNACVSFAFPLLLVTFGARLHSTSGAPGAAAQ